MKKTLLLAFFMMLTSVGSAMAYCYSCEEESVTNYYETDKDVPSRLAGVGAIASLPTMDNAITMGGAMQEGGGTALALGYSDMYRNGDIASKFGVSLDDAGNTSVGIGLGFKLK